MIRKAFVVLVPLFAGGCASTLPAAPVPYADPASPATQIRPVRHTSVLANYHPRQAVDPEPWGRRGGGEEGSEGAS